MAQPPTLEKIRKVSFIEQKVVYFYSSVEAPTETKEKIEGFVSHKVKKTHDVMVILFFHERKSHGKILFCNLPLLSSYQRCTTRSYVLAWCRSNQQSTLPKS